MRYNIAIILRSPTGEIMAEADLGMTMDEAIIKGLKRSTSAEEYQATHGMSRYFLQRFHAVVDSTRMYEFITEGIRCVREHEAK